MNKPRNLDFSDGDRERIKQINRLLREAAAHFSSAAHELCQALEPFREVLKELDQEESSDG